MPMDRSRYPEDWDAIALRVKTAANWSCQQCGKPCLSPDQSTLDFAEKIYASSWAEELCGEDKHGNPVFKLQRFRLTTAHLDQNPANNAADNLRALCAPCHLRHDRQYLQSNRNAKLERQGQMHLLEEPAGHGKDSSHIQTTLW